MASVGAAGMGGPQLAATVADARESVLPTHDPNLMVFLSDIHQHDNTVRWKNGPTQANEILPRLVKEIITLKPLPENAVVFGDFSASCGWIEDFRLAAAALKPLSDAGIVLTLGMGNHDNRANFMRVCPAYKARCLVPGRIVSKVFTPNADLILLDTLKSYKGEDWAGLLAEVEANYRGVNRDAVVAILSDASLSGREKKAAIRNMDGGATWSELVASHMCGLRSASVSCFKN